MKMKYIISGTVPVIFHEAIKHSDMRGLGNITGAGFVSITYNSSLGVFNCSCYGESESLNIKSNPERDKMYIERFFNRDF